MSHCQQHDLLLDLVYEELGPAEAAALTEHVQGCEPCRRELTGLRGVRGAMKADPAPEMAADAVTRMTERLLGEAAAEAARSAARFDEGAKVLPLRPRSRLARVLFHPAAGVMAAAALALVVIAANGWHRTLAPAMLPPPAVIHEDDSVAPAARPTPAATAAAPAAVALPDEQPRPAPDAVPMTQLMKSEGKAKAPLGYRVAPLQPTESLKKGSTAHLSLASDKETLDTLERSQEKPADRKSEAKPEVPAEVAKADTQADLPAKVVTASRAPAPRRMAKDAAALDDGLFQAEAEVQRNSNAQQRREELAQALRSSANGRGATGGAPAPVPAAAQAAPPPAAAAPAPEPAMVAQQQYAPPPPPMRNYGAMGHASNSSVLLAQLRAQLKAGQCAEARATATQLEQLSGGIPDEERQALQKACPRADSNSNANSNQYAAPSLDGDSNQAQEAPAPSHSMQRAKAQNQLQKRLAPAKKPSNAAAY